MWLTILFAIALVVTMALSAMLGGDASFGGSLQTMGDLFTALAPALLQYIPIMFVLFLANFLILFGPLVILGIQQIKGYEPGDADWGVRMQDVRGQAEAKEEITRVVSLWQSGEEFERAGGKRERGVLFLGAPGTGKTMLSKGIATSFNCPFVSIPGSGFAQTFIGMDAVIVRYLAHKAKKLAAKWGGQCIVFIDEIDAVGMRRQSLGSGFQPYRTDTVHDALFYGPDGALTSDGDLVLEDAAWRERLFRSRSEPPGYVYPAPLVRLSDAIKRVMIPGMGGMGGGGGLALNQLLVVMDGIDDPPATKRFITRRFNTFLDALYIVPQRIWKLRLRHAPAAPAQGGDLLHRGVQRAAAPAGPGAHPPGPDGPPHLLPHPGLGGPARHLRPLPGQGRARGGARRAAAARRARPHHQRLLAGDDRPGVLARAHVRARGRARALRARGPGGGDDHGRGGRGDRPALSEARGAGDRDPRGRPRRVRAPVHGEPPVDAALDPQARLLRRPPPGDGDRGPLRPLALGAGRRPDLDARRDGRRARLLRPEHDRASAATSTPPPPRRPTWSASTAWRRRRSTSRTASRTPRSARQAEKEAMERFEELGAKIMHRSGSGMLDGNPYAETLGDRDKRKLACGLLGQSFVVAWNTIRRNEDGTRHVAERLISARELYGDDVTKLLDGAMLRKPEIDVTDETTWPVI